MRQFLNTSVNTKRIDDSKTELMFDKKMYKHGEQVSSILLPHAAVYRSFRKTATKFEFLRVRWAIFRPAEWFIIIKYISECWQMQVSAEFRRITSTPKQRRTADELKYVSDKYWVTGQNYFEIVNSTENFIAYDRTSAWLVEKTRMLVPWISCMFADEPEGLCFQRINDICCPSGHWLRCKQNRRQSRFIQPDWLFVNQNPRKLKCGVLCMSFQVEPFHSHVERCWRERFSSVCCSQKASSIFTHQINERKSGWDRMPELYHRLKLGLA
jgi:hypothetical protein